MTRSNLRRRAAVVAALFSLSGLQAAAPALPVGDFDNNNPETFNFKDERGSVLNASTAYADPLKGKHVGIRYNIVPNGFGGWGVALKGMNASSHRYLAFDIRGDKGGEMFEVGLRDTKGQERKRPVALFSDVAKEWRRVLVPLTEFAGVSLASLDNLNLGFGARQQGRIYIDNIAFEPGPDNPAAGPTANKVVVDGFDRPTPAQAYRVFTGDQSQLTLSASRVLFDGDYSMELQYQFATNRPWGTWVAATRAANEPLDWSGIDAVKIWVKGDGSDTLFRFRFTEADGEIWEYVDRQALVQTRWAQVTMPIKEFKIVGQPPKSSPPDLAGVKSYEIALISPRSGSASGAKISAGRVQVDLLYVTGQGLQPGAVAPTGAGAPPATTPSGGPAAAPPVSASGGRIQGLAGGNVDFSVQAFTEYFYTPEEKSQVNHFAKLITTGRLGNFSARIEFGSISQEFGNASTFVGSSVTSTENRFPGLEMPSYQVFVTNLHPSVSLITLGNIFVDYSPDIFTPVFGFKGIEAQGDYDRLNYQVFAIKHPLNSFTAGSRGVLYFPNWRIAGYGVYWEQNARQANASSVSGGGLNPGANASVLRLERLAQDFTYNVEADGRLFDDRVRVTSVYGYNAYKQSAEADFTDPFNPIFSAPLDEAYEAGGHLWRTRFELYDITRMFGWRGTEFAYAYRDIGTGYKPRYRQVPVYYDDTDSDQWGHNARLVQRFGGWTASVDYDTMRRHSSSQYFQRKTLWGLGYYGYRGLDVSVTQDYRRETYRFTSDRSSFFTDTNEKVIGTEVYVRAQLTPRVAGWIKPRQERVWHPASNRNFTADSLHMRLEYYIANNAKLFAEHRTSRYTEPAFEPQGLPFDDNFTRVSFEVVF